MKVSLQTRGYRSVIVSSTVLISLIGSLMHQRDLVGKKKRE